MTCNIFMGPSVSYLGATRTNGPSGHGRPAADGTARRAADLLTSLAVAMAGQAGVGWPAFPGISLGCSQPQ